MQAKLKSLGMTPNPGGAATFGDMFRKDHALWTSVIAKAKIEPE
jgi:hypothetical protein